jgi:hypothetical protein
MLQTLTLQQEEKKSLHPPSMSFVSLGYFVVSSFFFLHYFAVSKEEGTEQRENIFSLCRYNL